MSLEHFIRKNILTDAREGNFPAIDQINSFSNSSKLTLQKDLCTDIEHGSILVMAGKFASFSFESVLFSFSK